MAIGIGSTARVITTAAAIMVAVFTSFVLDTDPTIKMLAVGMAVAVLIDASIVRMILVPALMSILGTARLVAASLAGPDHPRPAARGTDRGVRARARGGARARAGERVTNVPLTRFG